MDKLWERVFELCADHHGVKITDLVEILVKKVEHALMKVFPANSVSKICHHFKPKLICIFIVG